MDHFPVLLKEVGQYLSIDPAGVYVDCTLGFGGYAEAILSRLETGKLIAVDRDESAVAAARERLVRFGDRVSYYHGSYGDIEEAAKELAPLAGVVADLGWSRVQIEDPERGFSFQHDGPLDMRFDRRQELTAAHVVNHYDEREIADLLYELGGERRSRQIARAVVRGRPFRTTRQLAELVEQVVPRARPKKWGGTSLHPATRTFQALRIAVNDELGELDRLLEAAPSLLAPEGRMVVVSFHSLEDGRVKRAFRRWAQTPEYEILTRRVVRPTDEETGRNPASRSAKLRALARSN